MKRRKSLILLFVLVFTGVVLVGHTQAAYNVLDRECDLDELADKVCSQYYDLNGKLIYVTQINIGEDISDPLHESPTVGVDWPIKNYDGDMNLISLTWQYSIIGAVETEADCKFVPSSNFVYWELQGSLPTIIESDPPGAGLLKEQVKNCDLDSAERLKLNPEFSCKVDKKTDKFIRTVFSITTEVTGIDDRCSEFSLVTKIGCLSNDLLAMSGGSGTGYSGGQTIYCSDNQINTTHNECNGLIEEVTMSEANFVCSATAGDPDEVWFHRYRDGEENPFDSFAARDVGPRATGFTVCLNPPGGPGSPDDLIDGEGYAAATAIVMQGDNFWYGVIGDNPNTARCIPQP